MNIALPTLSPEGFLFDIGQTADKLLAYFLVNEYSQSNIYYGNIESLTYIIQRYGNDDVNLNLQVKERLAIYLERYFDNVQVQVTIVSPEQNTETLGYEIQLDITVVKDGKTYSVGKEISVLNSQLVKIGNRSNNG